MVKVIERENYWRFETMDLALKAQEVILDLLKKNGKLSLKELYDFAEGHTYEFLNTDVVPNICEYGWLNETHAGDIILGGVNKNTLFFPNPVRITAEKPIRFQFQDAEKIKAANDKIRETLKKHHIPNK